MSFEPDDNDDDVYEFEEFYVDEFHPSNPKNLGWTDR